MPAAYAHYRFACRAFAQLSSSLQEEFQDDKAFFLLAGQGPDPFFFYRPFRKNALRAIADQVHFQPGRVFFMHAKQVLAMSDASLIRQRRAYLFGFLTHFVLDATAHGFVEGYREKMGISHNKVESSFDSALLRNEKANPVQYNRARLLGVPPRAAEAVAPFFKIDAKEMGEVFDAHRAGTQWFYAPREVKERVLRFLIDLLHVPGNFEDLFLEKVETPSTHASNLTLPWLMDQALERYRMLSENLSYYLEGEMPLDPFFDRTFEADEPGRTDAAPYL